MGKPEGRTSLGRPRRSVTQIVIVATSKHASLLTQCVIEQGCQECIKLMKFQNVYYLLTYLLTPRCRVLLEKLTGLQLVKKSPAFHGTRRFITALTSLRHPSLSWASPNQSIYPHLIFTYCNLIFIGPWIANIFSEYNQQDAAFLKFIYFCKTLYMFQTSFPSIIRNTKLHIQRQAFVRPLMVLAARLPS